MQIKSFIISSTEGKKELNEFIKGKEVSKIEYTTEVEIYRVAHVYYK